MGKPCELDEAGGWALDAKAIIVCNPNNPTGAVATRAELEGEHVPMATLANDVSLVSLNGLSRSYLVPGWRVGWLAFHTPELLKDVAAAAQRLADARLCGPGPFQYAVKPALEGPQDHLPREPVLTEAFDHLDRFLRSH